MEKLKNRALRRFDCNVGVDDVINTTKIESDKYFQWK